MARKIKRYEDGETIPRGLVTVISTTEIRNGGKLMRDISYLTQSSIDGERRIVTHAEIRSLETRQWEFFRPEQLIPGAGIQIIKIKKASHRMDKTKYRVWKLCCDKREIMSHRFIMDKQRNCNLTCAACRHGSDDAATQAYKERRIRGEKKYDINPPIWKKPRSIPLGHFVAR